MKGRSQKAGPGERDTELRAKGDAGPAAAAPAAETSSGCCGAASGLSRLFGRKEKDKGQMTLAEIRKTYETGASEPPVRG